MARRAGSRGRGIKTQASKASTAKPSASAAQPASTRPSQFSSIVSTLKSRAASLTRRARTTAKHSTTLLKRRAAADATAGFTSRSNPAATPPAKGTVLKPVARQSIVKKPERRPTVRASRLQTTTTKGAASPKPARVMSAPRPAAPPPSSAALFSGVSPPQAFSPAPSRQAQTASDRASVEEAFSIPTGYGDDRIVLMVKDPWWLFAYWDIQPSTERAARAQLLPEEVAGLQSILRVSDVTPPHQQAGAHHAFDIPLSGLATNWYIHTNAPTRSFLVEIGLLTRGGRFVMLARSNRVTAPRFGPSEVIDEAWMTTDEEYWKLFGESTRVGGGASEGGALKLMAARLFGWNVSSGGFISPGRTAAVRGFWLRVDADLVIHGATEPKATVSVQGQPVTVRKDGTFHLRMALPEGTQTITIDVTSADGRRVRTATPVVTLSWAGALSSSEIAPPLPPTAVGAPRQGIA